MRVCGNGLISIALDFFFSSQVPLPQSSSFSVHLMYISTKTNTLKNGVHEPRHRTNSSTLYTASQISTHSPTT